METLGSLCDKLTIIKLKQYHSEDKQKLVSLSEQENQLVQEIDKYISEAINGNIPLKRLTFEANKIFKKEGNEIKQFIGGFGETFAELARVNCDLWHEQEKVYQFETVPVSEKDKIVKQLALLNLKRNNYIDSMNNLFKLLIEKNK